MDIVYKLRLIYFFGMQCWPRLVIVLPRDLKQKFKGET
jgi:hypothetical protein